MLALANTGHTSGVAIGVYRLAIPMVAILVMAIMEAVAILMLAILLMTIVEAILLAILLAILVAMLVVAILLPPGGPLQPGHPLLLVLPPGQPQHRPPQPRQLAPSL